MRSAYNNQIQISTSRLGKASLPAQSQKPMLNMQNASKYNLQTNQLSKGLPLDPQKLRGHGRYYAQSFATSRTNAGSQTNRRPISYSTNLKKSEFNVRGKAIQSKVENMRQAMAKSTIDYLQPPRTADTLTQGRPHTQSKPGFTTQREAHREGAAASPSTGKHYIANISVDKGANIPLGKTIDFNTIGSTDRQAEQEEADGAGLSSLERPWRNKGALSDNKFVQRVLNLDPNPQSRLLKRISNNMYAQKVSSQARHLRYHPMATQRAPRTGGASSLPHNGEAESKNTKTVQKKSAQGLSRIVPDVEAKSGLTAQEGIATRQAAMLSEGIASLAGSVDLNAGPTSTKNASDRVDPRKSCTTQMNARTELASEAPAQVQQQHQQSKQSVRDASLHDIVAIEMAQMRPAKNIHTGPGTRMIPKASPTRPKGGRPGRMQSRSRSEVKVDPGHASSPGQHASAQMQSVGAGPSHMSGSYELHGLHSLESPPRDEHGTLERGDSLRREDNLDTRMYATGQSDFRMDPVSDEPRFEEQFSINMLDQQRLSNISALQSKPQRVSLASAAAHPQHIQISAVRGPPRDRADKMVAFCESDILNIEMDEEEPQPLVDYEQGHGFSHRRESRTPIKITPQIQQQVFDPTTRFGNLTTLGQTEGERQSLNNIAASRYNQTQDSLEGARRRLAVNFNDGRSSAEEQIPSSARIANQGSLDGPADRPSGQHIGTSKMMTMMKNNQALTNRFRQPKKKQSQPRFIQKLQSARVFTQGNASSVNQRQQQSISLLQHSLNQTQSTVIEQSSQKQIHAPRLHNKSQHPPKFGIQKKATKRSRQRSKQFNSSVSSLFSDQKQPHRSENRKAGANQSQYHFRTRDAVNQVRDAPHLDLRVDGTASQTQKSRSKNPSVFAEQNVNRTGGSQNHSTSQLGHKKSPKFVQINLQMYNNFLPSNLSSHQGVMTASATDGRQNTINFGEPSHQGNPGGYSKPQVFPEKYNGIMKSKNSTQVLQRPSSVLEKSGAPNHAATQMALDLPDNTQAQSGHGSIVQNQVHLGSTQQVSGEQYLNTPTTELISSQIQQMSHQIEEIQRKQLLCYSKLQGKAPVLEQPYKVKNHYSHDKHQQILSQGRSNNGRGNQEDVHDLAPISGANLFEESHQRRPSSAFNLQQPESTREEPMLASQHHANYTNHRLHPQMAQANRTGLSINNNSNASAHSEKEQLNAVSHDSSQLRNTISIENINTGTKQGISAKQLSGTNLRTPLCAAQPLMGTFQDPPRSLSIFKINSQAHAATTSRPVSSNAIPTRKKAQRYSASTKLGAQRQANQGYRGFVQTQQISSGQLNLKEIAKARGSMRMQFQTKAVPPLSKTRAEAQQKSVDDIENALENQKPGAGDPGQAYSSNVINILEIEKMEARYRKQLEQNLNNMRDNHTNQINNLMEVIKQKDAQIEQLQMRQLGNTEQRQNRNKIDDVYAMIGKVRENMEVIAQMNKQAHEEHLVNTISSSNSSPTHTIKSVSMRQSNPFGDKSQNSRSDLSLQGSYSLRKRQTMQLPVVADQVCHSSQSELETKRFFVQSERELAESQQEIRPSLLSRRGDGSKTQRELPKMKPRSALLVNKSSTSRIHGQHLAPIFSGGEDSSHCSVIQIDNQEEKK